MAATRTLTSLVADSIRSNDDGSEVLVATVTYDDASAKAVEIPIRDSYDPHHYELPRYEAHGWSD